MAKTPTQIKSLARSHTEAAIKTLAGIMNQETAPESARISAANSLLDRGWGKAEATVTIDDKRDSTDWTRAELVAFLANATNGGRGATEADGRSGEPDQLH